MASQNSNCKGHGINEEILGTCCITLWELQEHVGNPLKTCLTLGIMLTKNFHPFLFLHSLLLGMSNTFAHYSML
jgi:hypothetical protein